MSEGMNYNIKCLGKKILNKWTIKSRIVFNAAY